MTTAMAPRTLGGLLDHMTDTPQYIYAIRTKWDGIEPFLVRSEIVKTTPTLVRTAGTEVGYRSRHPRKDCHFSPQEAWVAYSNRLEDRINTAVAGLARWRRELEFVKKAREALRNSE